MNRLRRELVDLFGKPTARRNREEGKRSYRNDRRGYKYLRMAKMTDRTARRHHYLPAAYLASFTDTGKKEGQFFVIEVSSGRSFRTSPKNVAVERDFNRVNIYGLSPDAIERGLSSFEQKAVKAVRQILDSTAFLEGDDYHYVMNLICLIAGRNPSLGIHSMLRENRFWVFSRIC